MKVFCPNCGSENDGMSGGRVTCRACTATFEVPRDSGAPAGGFGEQPPSYGAPPAAPPSSAPPFGGQQQGGGFGGSATPQPSPGGWGQPPPSSGWAQPPTNQPLGSSFPSSSSPIASYSQPGSAGSPTTNTLAIVSLVCGILCCIPLTSLAAVITGSMAMKQIDASGGAQKGKELAIIGVVLGGLSILGTIVYIIAAIATQ